MATQFVFSVANDTLNGAVSSVKLDEEIRGDLSIPVELGGVSVSGDDLTIIFQSDLTPTQESQLSSLVGAHDGIPPPKTPVISTRSSDGSLRVVQEPSASTSLMQIVGFKMSPDSPADEEEVPKRTDHDFVVPIPLDIQGVHSIWMEDGSGHEDDYLDFTIIFPQGATEAQWSALGLGTWYFSPSTVCPLDIELLRYGVNVYLPHDGQIIQVMANGSKTVAPPLRIRMSYFSHEVSPVKPVKLRGNIRWWLLQKDSSD